MRDTGTRGDHTATRGVARTLGGSGGWPAAILGNLSAPSKEKVWGPRDIPDQAEGRKGARRTCSSRNAISACGRTNENPLKKRNPPVPAGGSYTTPHDLNNSNATEIPNRVSQACSRSKISSGWGGRDERKERGNLKLMKKVFFFTPRAYLAISAVSSGRTRAMEEEGSTGRRAHGRGSEHLLRLGSSRHPGLRFPPLFLEAA